MEVRVVGYKVAYYEHTRGMKRQKVKIPAVWGFLRGWETAFQKAEISGFIFRALSPPCFASADDGQPLYLLEPPLSPKGSHVLHC